MKAVEVRTGLSAHVIRIWERRYRAVNPVRSDNLRRLYNEEEVERLTLMGQLTNSGMAISQIANLTLEELRSHKARYRPVSPMAPAGDATPGFSQNPEAVRTSDRVVMENSIDAALQAIRRYDIAELEKIFDRGMLAVGSSGLLHKLLIPLLHAVGDAWETGDLTAAQEHGATVVMKDYLAKNFRSMQLSDTAPRLLVTTPAGQLHEMGAYIAASLARNAGWNVTYLGPSLPAEEIASAVFANQFRAVALSIIYPADDPELPRQITRLRQLLPVGMPIIIGGAAAAAYQETIDQIGATTLHDMADLFRILVEVRNPGTTPQPKPEALPTRMLNNGSHNGSEGAPLKTTKRPKGQVV